MPTAWLDRVFAAAIQRQRTPFLLAPGEVLAAWDDLLSERQFAAAQTDPAHLLPAGPICTNCGGVGWLLDRTSGPVGHRAARQCGACNGYPAAIPAKGVPPGPAEYRVQNILPVLQSFCEEHHDPLSFPIRLAYAVTCGRAGVWADDLRTLLESTAAPTLYGALAALGLPVDPPPPPGTHPPGSIGALLEGYPA